MWRLCERPPGAITTALRLHLRRTPGKPEAARLRELLEQAEAAAEAKAKQERSDEQLYYQVELESPGSPVESTPWTPLPKSSWVSPTTRETRLGTFSR
jgi:hypothetical protein